MTSEPTKPVSIDTDRPPQKRVAELEQTIRQQADELDALRRELGAARGEADLSRRACEEAQKQARLLDEIEQAVITTDLEGTVLTWNRCAERLYGWTRDDVVGRNIQDVVTAEKAQVEGEQIMDQIRTGSSWGGEFEVRRKDGSAFAAWVTDSPVRDEAGTVIGIVGISTDITALKEVEKRLKASENRFRAMIDQLPMSLQVFDRKGVSLQVNPAWEQMWGSTGESVRGYNILQDEHVKRMGHLPLIERAFGGEAVRLPMVRFDPAEVGRPGPVRCLDVRVYPIRDAGAVREIALLVQDITEQVEIEDERSRFLELEQEARTRSEEAQRRLEFLAEASRILASSLDYQTTLDQVARLAVPLLADWCDIQVLDESGVIRRVAVAHPDPAKEALAYELDRCYPVDPAAERGVPNVLRTGRPEVYPEMPDELLVPGMPDEERSRAARELGLKSAIVMPLVARGRTLGAMSLIFAESSRHFSVEEIALAEELARRAGAAIDNSRLYTEAQTAASRHERVESKLTLLSDATGTLIGTLDINQVFTRVIALAQQLVSADAYAVWRFDAEPRRWRIAASEGLSERYRSSAAEALEHSLAMPSRPIAVSRLADEPILSGHLNLLLQEGIQAMLVQPLQMHSAVGGTLVCYFRSPHRFDETELKISGALANIAASAIVIAELYAAANQRADQLAEADRLKDEFLAMLAHELRNPLAAISNAVQVFDRAAPDAPSSFRARDVMDRQARHMTRLVDELLDVSRVSRGLLTLHAERIDLRQLVETTAEDHRRILSEHGLSLSLELPPRSLWVDADPTRLRQALGNLLNNAGKFTDAGGSVSVRVMASDADGHIRIAVADTGIGIAQDLLPRLFEPFVQADRSLDRSQGGLGLGLALVKGIMDLHQGSVEAHSGGHGLGSEFVLEIRYDPSAAPADAAPAVAVSQRARARILVIEDNLDVAETLRDVLDLLGHEAELAHTGPEGIERARTLRPDIVLCDVGLPGMDGYQVAAALREDPAMARTRLIAISGYGRDEDRERSQSSGFELHLTKPIDPRQLEEILSSRPPADGP